MLFKKCDECKTEVLSEQIIQVSTQNGLMKEVCPKCKYKIQLNENSNLLNG